jgi:hypothetical protein
MSAFPGGSKMGAVATPLQPLEAPEHPRLPRRIRSRKLFEPELVREALKQSFVMLRPDIQWSNPVMFVVEIGAMLTLLFIVQALVSTSVSQVPITYFIALDFWLFLTVLFANFATARRRRGAKLRLRRCVRRVARHPPIDSKPAAPLKRCYRPISNLVTVSS